MTPKKIYYVKGKVFNENTSNKSLAFARHYAKENNIDFKEIYELSNESEVKYLETLLERVNIKDILVNQKVELIKEFKNNNKDTIPPLTINVSFIFRIEGGYASQKYYVKVIDSVYDLTKQFINEKILFDCLYVNEGYLQVMYLDKDGTWKEWKIGNIELSIQEKKERHKKYLAQKKVIRDRQKLDRLIRLRSNGTITENQSKELYRLEKIFGGKE